MHLAEAAYERRTDGRETGIGGGGVGGERSLDRRRSKGIDRPVDVDAAATAA